MQNDNLKHYLILQFIVFIWGFTAVLGALITIDAVAISWYRMFFGAAFIAVYMAMVKIPFKIALKPFFGFSLAGVILAAHWLTFFLAIKVSNVSICLAVISTGAFFTAILEPLVYKRKAVWYEIAFGLLVLFGLYLIFKVETPYITGILLSLLSAFLYAIFALINGKFVQKHKPSVISFYELLIGALALFLYMVFTDRVTTDFFTIGTANWVYLLILASICTAYAIVGSVKVMRYLTPYTVMLTTNLEPVYGIILAFFILGEKEQMHSGFYIGALLILSTVIINGILKSYKKKNKQHR